MLVNLMKSSSQIYCFALKHRLLLFDKVLIDFLFEKNVKVEFGISMLLHMTGPKTFMCGDGELYVALGSRICLR